MKKINNWFDRIIDKTRALDIAMLIARLAFAGSLVLAHGLPKLLKYSERVESFSDPLGIGSMASLIATIGTELFCSAMVLIGLGTRLFALPVMFTMGVIVFVVHGAAPYNKQELALLFLIGYSIIFLLGPGRISFDYMLKRGK